MGLNLFVKNGHRSAPAANDEALRERFGTHFPQLFAYARSWVGDDEAAKQIVADAFTQTFSRGPNLPDGEFRLVLFGVAHRLCRSAANHKPQPDDALNSREREVLCLAATGHTNHEIAEILHLSKQTVHNVRARLMEKLGVHNRLELLKYALRQGIVTTET